MKEILLNNLQEGMIVAANVMTKNGQCILQKGKVLNRQIIMRLSFYNIPSIMVAEEDTVIEPDTTPVTSTKLKPKPISALFQNPAPAPEAAPQPQQTTLKVQNTRKSQALQLEHIIALSTLKDSFEDYVNNGIPFEPSLLLDIVHDRFASCKTSVELLNMIHNMHSIEDSIYAHSLNVALICRQIGKWLKFDDTDLDILTLCGLLHDIGKLKIPEEILNKPSKYTDEEFAMVKMHTQYGYDLLKSLPLDSHIKKAALSHHERCDGSGYPTGLTQDDTDDYAMIVSIADVYDAMTAARSYRAPLCPFQVIERFEKEGLQKYSPKYILTFLNHIADTYRNHRVLLSDGRSATVVMINNQQLSKPIVQLDDNTCIDLATTRDLIIQTVLP